jgi:hypothetical protein
VLPMRSITEPCIIIFLPFLREIRKMGAPVQPRFSPADKFNSPAPQIHAPTKICMHIQTHLANIRHTNFRMNNTHA